MGAFAHCLQVEIIFLDFNMFFCLFTSKKKKEKLKKYRKNTNDCRKYVYFLAFFPVCDRKSQKKIKNTEKDGSDLLTLFASRNTQHLSILFSVCFNRNSTGLRKLFVLD